MISVWWSLVAFIAGTWVGIFLVALMRMSTDRTDLSLDATDSDGPRSQPPHRDRLPWDCGRVQLVQHERSGQ